MASPPLLCTKGRLGVELVLASRLTCISLPTYRSVMPSWAPLATQVGHMSVIFPGTSACLSSGCSLALRSGDKILRPSQAMSLRACMGAVCCLAEGPLGLEAALSCRLRGSCLIYQQSCKATCSTSGIVLNCLCC